MNKDSLRKTNCNDCKTKIHCKQHCNCQEIRKLYEKENEDFDNEKRKQFKYNEKLVEHGIKVAKKDKQLMKILKRLSLN